MNEFFRESFLESKMTQKIPQKIREIEDLKIKQKKFGKMECAQEFEYFEKKMKESQNNINLKNDNENKGEPNNNIIININSLQTL
jgi:hypothetical protein